MIIRNEVQAVTLPVVIFKSDDKFNQWKTPLAIVTECQLNSFDIKGNINNFVNIFSPVRFLALEGC